MHDPVHTAIRIKYCTREGRSTTPMLYKRFRSLHFFGMGGCTRVGCLAVVNCSDASTH